MPMHRSWRNRRSTLLLRASFLLCQRTILPCLSFVIVQPLLLGKWRRTRHPRRGAFNNNSIVPPFARGHRCTTDAEMFETDTMPLVAREKRSPRPSLDRHPSSTCSCSNASMSVHAECQHEDFHDHGACVASCRSWAIWVKLEAAA